MSNKAQESAVLFAQSEVQGAKAIELLAVALGDAPTFDQWETVRTDWTAEYAKARKANDEASSKAWQRAALRLKETYALEKPKAPSKAAEKKAESRKDAKETKASIVKSLCGTDTPALAQITPHYLAINNEMGAALKAGDMAKVAELRPKADAIDAAHKAAFKAESKAQAETMRVEMDGLKDEIRDWMKSASMDDLKAVVASIRKAKGKAKKAA